MKTPRHHDSGRVGAGATEGPEESRGVNAESWNRIGREKAARVCAVLEDIIDRGENANEDLLAPRPGVGLDEDQESSDDSEGADLGGTSDCAVNVGSYDDIKARFGGPLDIDECHAAISPDGQYLAYGWQDAWDGHYVDRVPSSTIEPLGRIAARSEYPYRTYFTGDSKSVVSNSRYGLGGVTVCCDIAALTAGEDLSATDGVLHVIDPFTEAEPGRERGYHPRRELFRWVFWGSLNMPTKW